LTKILILKYAGFSFVDIRVHPNMGVLPNRLDSPHLIAGKQGIVQFTMLSRIVLRENFPVSRW
jgi:hypothetical protein